MSRGKNKLILHPLCDNEKDKWIKRGIEMDKELMELLEQKMFAFSKREDLERLRQDFHASFHKLKEESRNLLIGEMEQIKTELENLRRESQVDLAPLARQFEEETRNLELKVQSMLLQSIQPMESSLGRMKEETLSSFLCSQKEIESLLQAFREEIHTNLLKTKQEMASDLRFMKEEGNANLTQSWERGFTQLTLWKEEMKGELNHIGKGIDSLQAQVRTALGEIAVLNEKVKEGFIEVREELGAMIKFSYADLEKRIAALEARVKALEKQNRP